MCFTISNSSFLDFSVRNGLSSVLGFCAWPRITQANAFGPPVSAAGGTVGLIKLLLKALTLFTAYACQTSQSIAKSKRTHHEHSHKGSFPFSCHPISHTVFTASSRVATRHFLPQHFSYSNKKIHHRDTPRQAVSPHCSKPPSPYSTQKTSPAGYTLRGGTGVPCLYQAPPS